MPGGYGTEDTPWGTGGTTSAPGAFVSGVRPTGGSNLVAEAANDIKQAQALGVNDKGQTVQEAQASFANTLAQSGQSGIAGLSANQIQSQINAQAAADAAAAAAAAIPPDEKKGIVDSIMGNTMVANLLKGTQSTDRFFKKLASGKPLTTEDKIILANLIAANKKNPKVLGDLEKYLEEYDVSEEYLQGRLDEEKEAFEGESLENIESLIEDYLAGKPTGIDSLTSMIGDLSGSADKKWNIYEEDWEGDTYEEYSPTLEQLKKQIKPEGLAYLKANRPDLYYSFMQPTTTGSLEELAGETTFTGENLTQQEKDFNQQIFDARAELDKQKYDQGIGDVGGGAGITNLEPLQQLAATVPAATTTTVPAATTTTVPAATTTTIPAATTTAATMTTPTPFDYSQLGPHFTSAYPGSNYVNQGLGQGPNFDYWNQIARTFPGMRNYG